MDTTQITQTGRQTRTVSRRSWILLVACLALFAAIAVGVGASRASTPAPPARALVSVAPGHHQPATLIHRMSMRPISDNG
jgi:hypothetical protein